MSNPTTFHTSDDAESYPFPTNMHQHFSTLPEKRQPLVKEALVIDPDIPTPDLTPLNRSPMDAEISAPVKQISAIKNSLVVNTDMITPDMTPLERSPLTPLDVFMPAVSQKESFTSAPEIKDEPVAEVGCHSPLELTHLEPRMDSWNKPLSGATKLRRMVFETKELVVCPGVYDGLSARTAMEVGFQALYMTGAGTTASRLGEPDLAIAQLYEMRENADMIAGLDPYGPPLIADMDTGYGGPLMVARTVEQYIRSGVAGAHLEDQVLMKRCGHLGGKKVVPREDYLQRIRAAHQARCRLQSDFILIARTDALQSMGYDECIARLKGARDIGADVGLLEGFKTKEQAAQAVKDLAPWPLMYNSVENGASPTITVDEARAMGFRIMVFSFATLAPAYTAIRDALMRLKTIGAVGTPKEITPVRLFEVCGLKNSMAIDTESGGSAFEQDLSKV